MLFQLVPSSRPFEFQGFNELAGCIWLGFHVVNHRHLVIPHASSMCVVNQNISCEMLLIS